MRLFAYVAVLTFLTAVSARSEAPQEIDFRYQDGLIWLKAEVPAKTKSLNFLLDSGAGVSVVDLNQALRPRDEGWQSRVSAGGQRACCRLPNRRFPGELWRRCSAKIGIGH